MNRLIFTFFITALLVPGSLLAGTNDRAKHDAYIYDKEDFGQYYRELIYLKDKQGAEIPFYLSYPKAQKAKAVVILLHGITSHKEVWWQGDGPYSSRGEYRQSLLKHGIAVIAMDARFHGQRAHEFRYRNPKNDLLFNQQFDGLYEMLEGSVSDASTLIDYVQSRPKFKGLKMGVLGDSMGGIMSFPLAVNDEEISFMVALAASPLPVPSDEKISSLSPLPLAHKLTKPVRIIAAKRDRYYPMELMHEMFQKISSKDKKLIVVDEEHDFQTTHAEEISDWILQIVI